MLGAGALSWLRRFALRLWDVILFPGRGVASRDDRGRSTWIENVRHPSSIGPLQEQHVHCSGCSCFHSAVLRLDSQQRWVVSERPQSSSIVVEVRMEQLVIAIEPLERHLKLGSVLVTLLMASRLEAWPDMPVSSSTFSNLPIEWCITTTRFSSTSRSCR